ncbi:MAG: hypothetical protein M3O73_05100 [Actinomycetota bacterium]|nr:hypothetical protein [Actinomycetota bacterium]
MTVPPLIRDVFELLAREEEDALVQLAAIRTLRGWLGGRERLSLAAARPRSTAGRRSAPPRDARGRRSSGRRRGGGRPSSA